MSVTGLPRTVALVTLGCTRNEVDSEELAGRLADGGWTLVDEVADADVAVVNTCGFIEQAKKDSIDVILEAAEAKEMGRTKAVVAVGCLAQRYGTELAAELPEADAVLGFDSYAQMSDQLAAILAGERPVAPTPGDRRHLLPLTPASRQQASTSVAIPGHGTGPEAGCGSGPGADPGTTDATRTGRAAHTGPAGGHRPGQWSAGGTAAARAPPLGAAEDRERLRPALQLLRDPDVQGGLRLPAS
jgi:hypothetical protein